MGPTTIDIEQWADLMKVFKERVLDSLMDFHKGVPRSPHGCHKKKEASYERVKYSKGKCTYHPNDRHENGGWNSELPLHKAASVMSIYGDSSPDWKY